MSTTQAGPHTGSASGLGTAARDSFRQRGFVIALVALAAMVAGFHLMTPSVQFRKKAAPLRRSLSLLDKNALVPYQFESATTINPDVLDSLGTDQYIEWMLTDNSISENQDPTKRVSLFITYYTGQPDLVPHVPENGFFGSGFRVMSSQDSLVDVPGVGSVPLRVLEFNKPGRLGVSRPTVAYTFIVNNRFTCDRINVRNELGNPREEYGYYAKIEVHFSLPVRPACHERPDAGARESCSDGCCRNWRNRMGRTGLCDAAAD